MEKARSVLMTGGCKEATHSLFEHKNGGPVVQSWETFFEKRVHTLYRMKMTTADQAWRATMEDRKRLHTLYRMKMMAGQSWRENIGKRLHTSYKMKMMTGQPWRENVGKRLPTFCRMKKTAGQSWRGDVRKRLRTVYRMKMTAGQSWRGDIGKTLRTSSDYRMKMAAGQSWRGDIGKRLRTSSGYRMKMTVGQSWRGDVGKRLRTSYRMKKTASQSWRGEVRKRLCTFYRMKKMAGQSWRGDVGKSLHTAYRMKKTAGQSWRSYDGKRLRTNYRMKMTAGQSWRDHERRKRLCADHGKNKVRDQYFSREKWIRLGRYLKRADSDLWGQIFLSRTLYIYVYFAHGCLEDFYARHRHRHPVHLHNDTAFVINVTDTPQSCARFPALHRVFRSGELLPLMKPKSRITDIMIPSQNSDIFCYFPRCCLAKHDSVDCPRPCHFPQYRIILSCKRSFGTAEQSN